MNITSDFLKELMNAEDDKIIKYLMVYAAAGSDRQGNEPLGHALLSEAKLHFYLARIMNSRKGYSKEYCDSTFERLKVANSGFVFDDLFGYLFYKLL